MPTYDYVCDACGHAFEHFQSMSSAHLRTCPACKKRKLRRLIGSGAGVIFKGGGFYETDYKKGRSGGKTESSSETSSESSTSKDAGTSSDSASKSDAKPAADTSAKPADSAAKKPAKKGKDA